MTLDEFLASEGKPIGASGWMVYFITGSGRERLRL